MSYHANQKDISLGTAYPYDLNWDASLIFGCKCDEGFSGYDCSLRTCRTGLPPAAMCWFTSCVVVTLSPRIAPSPSPHRPYSCTLAAHCR